MIHTHHHTFRMPDGVSSVGTCPCGDAVTLPNSFGEDADWWRKSMSLGTPGTHVIPSDWRERVWYTPRSPSRRAWIRLVDEEELWGRLDSGQE